MTEAADQRTLIVADRERGVLSVAGPDRATWLNGIVTCDTSKVSVSEGVYGLLLNKLGKIQTDLDIIEADGVLLLGLAPSRAEPTRAALDRMLVMEDAEVADRSAELGCIRVHGPQASELAAAVRDGVRGHGRIDWTGVGGELVVVERARYQDVVERLVELGGELATADSWRRLRTEQLFPEFGVDYDEQDNPHEAALEQRAVSFDKGCYLGQEVVCMQDMRGRVKRRLVGLRLDGSSEPSANVEAGGEVVGELRTVSGGEPVLALARVRAPHFETGTALEVGGVRATVFGAPRS
ncbi:MAG: folate-binding protein YgfZ [Polyangiaceae bacterium]|nr:folate-binding protein YgfZ [Polyangiaceae bacterium]